MKIKALMLLPMLCTLVLSTLACSRPLDSEDPCNFVQNPNQQRVSWPHRSIVKLYVHQSVPREAYAAIDRAVNEYNLKIGEGREIFRIVARGVGGELSPSKDGYSMIYWFDQWDVNRPTEQARTTIYWSGTEIFEADIRINAAFFREYSDFNRLDLESLMVHEFGHALGLGHNVNNGSVMNFTLSEGEDRRELGSLDIASLKCEY